MNDKMNKPPKKDYWQGAMAPGQAGRMAKRMKKFERIAKQMKKAGDRFKSGKLPF